MMENEAKPMTTKELTATVQLLLQREEERAESARRRQQQRVRQGRQRRRDRAERMLTSIEVIKWCIVSITAVMVLAIITLIYVVGRVESEVQRVKGEAERIMVEVEEIKSEAERIGDKIRHPLETIGGTLGRRLEGSIEDALRPSQ